MTKHDKIKQDAGDVEAGINLFNGSIAEDVDYQTERRDLIARLKAKEYPYKNWSRFSNNQLYQILQKNPPQTKRKVATPSDDIRPTCTNCGTRLTDGRYCPVCDDGEEHLHEMTSLDALFELRNIDEEM